MSKKIEKVTGKVEIIVPEELDVIGGFTSDLCVDAIKNTQMRKQVLAYRKAIGQEMSAQWARAIAIAKMTVDMRKEFGSDSRLAQFLGLRSRGEFSRQQAAGKLALEAQKQGVKVSELPSLSIVYELLPVANEKHGKQDLLGCAKHVAENEMTQSETRDYVKSFVVADEKPAEEKPAEEKPTTNNVPSTDQKEEEVRWLNILALDAAVLADTETDLLNEFFKELERVALSYFEESEVWVRK